MYNKKNFALFMAQPENEFSIQVLNGVSKATKEQNINLFVFPIGLIDGVYTDQEATQYRYQNNILEAFFHSKSLDGAIIEYGTMVSNIGEEQKKEFLAKIGDIPVILLSEDAPGFKSVGFDNRSGLVEIITHLIQDHKYKKIGYISGPKDNQDAQERLQVWKDSMKENGIMPEDSYIRYGNFSEYSTDAVRSLLEEHPDVEAIVCANDDMAFAAYRVLEEMGLCPGKDIAVTGFDNVPNSKMCQVPLTTVQADASEMAYQAVKALAQPNEKQLCRPVYTKMKKRRSCGCDMEFVYDDNGNLMGTSDQVEFREAAQ